MKKFFCFICSLSFTFLLESSLKQWRPSDLTAQYQSLNWQRVTISSDGQIQTAAVLSLGASDQGNIFFSNDYGNTWTPCSQNWNVHWSSLSMSLNGSTQLATVEESSVYSYSNQTGLWQATFLPVGNWTGSSISQYGQCQTVIANQYYSSYLLPYGIYTSYDKGFTWQGAAPPSSWINVAMSEYGNIQVAVSMVIFETTDYNQMQGRILKSGDFGTTWTIVESMPKGFYTCVAISSCGCIQVVGENNCNYAPALPGNLWISRDFGQTFVPANAPKGNWLGISMSYDGKYIVAVAYQQQDSYNIPIPGTGIMVLSTDYGKSFSLVDVPESPWTSVSISKDGSYGAATIWGQGIYISTP
ncbi:MAG: hypothetical protein EBZ47_01840 [Chlamydiae bacterium]|nr:hypothetical protein [Chlamydiota bacterium]